MGLVSFKLDVEELNIRIALLMEVSPQAAPKELLDSCNVEESAHKKLALKELEESERRSSPAGASPEALLVLVVMVAELVLE